MSQLISIQQESGQLQTGLRKWKMRRSRRNVEDLPDADAWACPFGCGKRYRSTSSRSIQNHANGCDNRNDDGVGDVDVKRLKTEHDEERRRTRQQENERETATRTGRIKREDQGSGSSAGEGVGSPQRMQARTAGDTDIDHNSFFSPFPSDVVLSLPSPPSPIGIPCDPASLGDTCSPGSTSSLASVDPTCQPLDFAARVEPVLIARTLQEAELLPLPQSHDDTLERQRQQVAAELQQLLLDIYRRHGTQHPVFDHPVMASCLTGLLNQGANRATAEWSSITPPMQASSSNQQSSLPWPTQRTTDLPSSPRSPPLLNHLPKAVPSPDFDTSTFVHTSPADAAGASATVVYPRRASPTVSSPGLLGLGFCVDSSPSAPRLCPSIPARPPSRLALSPSPYSAPVPFASPPSDQRTCLLLEPQCHIVDSSQSTLAQCLLNQLNARVPDSRLVLLGDRDANALRKVRVSGELDFIVDRMEYFRDVVDELYLSSADVETQGCGVEEEQQQPYFHATFFVRERQCV